MEEALQDVAPVAPSLVLLVGPPCSGKTKYYHQHYGRTHLRISAAEHFQTFPQASLHKIVNMAMKHLANGENVVIDDYNHLPRTRSSFIKMAQSRVPFCTITCVRLIPVGGTLQCQWALEWLLAEQAVPLDSNGRPTRSYNTSVVPPLALDQWFSEVVEPRVHEGFKETISETVSLRAIGWDFCDTEALLVDANAILTIAESDSFTIRDSAAAVFTEWKQLHPSGRIILLIDEVSLFPLDLEQDSHLGEQYERRLRRLQRAVRRTLRELSEMLTSAKFPIYYIIAEYEQAAESANDAFGILRRSFFRPPDAGMVAWVQRLHRIRLENMLLVIDNSASNPNLNEMAKFVGISVISADQFFASSGWSVDSKIRKFSRDNSYFRAPFLNNIVESATSPPPVSMPLFSQYEVSFPKTRDGQRCPPIEPVTVEASSGYGRIHGAVFPEQFPIELSPSASSSTNTTVVMTPPRGTATDNTTTPTRRRNLPRWMTTPSPSPRQRSRSPTRPPTTGVKSEISPASALAVSVHYAPSPKRAAIVTATHKPPPISPPATTVSPPSVSTVPLPSCVKETTTAKPPTVQPVSRCLEVSSDTHATTSAHTTASPPATSTSTSGDRLASEMNRSQESSSVEEILAVLPDICDLSSDERDDDIMLEDVEVDSEAPLERRQPRSSPGKRKLEAATHIAESTFEDNTMLPPPLKKARTEAVSTNKVAVGDASTLPCPTVTATAVSRTTKSERAPLDKSLNELLKKHLGHNVSVSDVLSTPTHELMPPSRAETAISNTSSPSKPSGPNSPPLQADKPKVSLKERLARMVGESAR